MRSRSLLITLLLPLAVACGDSGPKRLDNAAFVAQADAICKAGDATIAALPRPVVATDIAAYAAPAAAAVRAEYEALKALVPPADVQDKTDALLVEVGKVVEVADGLVVVARTNDAAKITAYIEANRAVDTKANELARALGMKECGRAVQ
jgi:hypothetical protein